MRLWDRRPHLEPRTGGENKRGLTRDGKSAGGAVDVTTKRKITWRNFLALLHWKLKWRRFTRAKKFSKWFWSSVHARRQFGIHSSECLKWTESRKPLDVNCDAHERYSRYSKWLIYIYFIVEYFLLLYQQWFFISCQENELIQEWNILFLLSLSYI